MRTGLPMLALLACAAPTCAFAAESIEKVAACKTADGVAGVEMIVTNVPSDQVRDRVVAATGIRLLHGERIGTHKVTVMGLGCLPLRTALGILSSTDDEHTSAVLVDNKGAYRLVDMPHHGEITRLRTQAAELVEKDEAQRRVLLEKIIPLAAPATPDGYEELISDVYADLTDMAVEQKDYARAETLSRARMAQFERLEVTDDGEYGSALAQLGYAHWHLGRDEAAAELERALAVLRKHAGSRETPEAARVAATLVQIAIKTKQFERAATFSRQAAEILASPERDGWDALNLLEARIADLDAELAAGAAAVEADRSDAAPYFERALLREKDLRRPDILQSYPREMVATLSEDPAALEDVAAFYAGVRVDPAIFPSSDDAAAVWGLALIRAKQGR